MKIIPPVVGVFLLAASLPLLVPAFSGPAWSNEEKVMKLPDPDLSSGRPLMAVLYDRRSERSFDKTPLSKQLLAEILWAAVGVNRTDGSNRRTSPTAMNHQDVELYALTSEGAFLYDALGRQLIMVAEGDQTRHLGAPLGLVYVSPPTRWAGANAAFCAQNVYLYAASEGLNTVVKGTFDAPVLGDLLKLPEGKAVIMVQPVGPPPSK